MKLDLIDPYTLSNTDRFRYVLIIVDYFHKWVELALVKKASAKTVASAFFYHLVSKYGAPLKVIRDNGPVLFLVFLKCFVLNWIFPMSSL